MEIKKGSMLYFAEQDYMYLKSSTNKQMFIDRTLCIYEQAVEKYLKVLLKYYCQEINTSHNITYIYRKITPHVEAIKGFEDEVRFLRECYYDRNYENDSYYELTVEEYLEWEGKIEVLLEVLRGEAYKVTL